MKRRISNLLVAASLALCLLSAGMWARSQSTDDAWLSKPETLYRWETGPQWRDWNGRHAGVWGRYAYHRFHIVGSANGRLVFVAFEEFDYATWHPQPPTMRTGWYRPAPATMLNRATYVPLVTGNSRFQIPGAVEWASAPTTGTFTFTGPRQYFSVSWLVFVALFAIPPALGARRWWKRSRRPAFTPILPLAVGSRASASCSRSSPPSSEGAPSGGALPGMKPLSTNTAAPGLEATKKCRVIS